MLLNCFFNVDVLILSSSKFIQIFGNPEPFDEDELINVRQRCASLILEFIQGTKNV